MTCHVLFDWRQRCCLHAACETERSDIMRDKKSADRLSSQRCSRPQRHSRENRGSCIPIDIREQKIQHFCLLSRDGSQESPLDLSVNDLIPSGGCHTYAECALCPIHFGCSHKSSIQVTACRYSYETKQEIRSIILSTGRLRVWKWGHLPLSSSYHAQ